MSAVLTLSVHLVRATLLLCAIASLLAAQPFRTTAAHLGTTARVLLVGTRPDDEDNALIALLSRGRQIETAYLSLTRGESGVNGIGSERSAPLAVVRTAELLAERQRDGARQYFTRAFDMGPVGADSIVERLWPRDSLLVDLVAVLRAFRPHVVIALSSVNGEPDATRRYTARVLSDAFAIAGDTTRLSTRAASFFGAWTPSRLYTRVDSAGDPSRIIRLDVGAFDRGEGLTYAELGAEIRLLQRTQPPLAAPTKGTLMRLLRRDDTNGAMDDALFGPADTTLARVGAIVPEEARAHFDTLQTLLARIRSIAQTGGADTLAADFARIAARATDVRREMECRDYSGVASCPGALGDLAFSLNTIRERATRGMREAAGLVIDGVSGRELVASGDSVPVTITLRNGGRVPLTISGVMPFHREGSAGGDVPLPRVLAPDSTMRVAASLLLRQPTYHWWQINGMVAGTMLHAVRASGRDPMRPQLVQGEDRIPTAGVKATVTMGGVEVPVIVGPLVARATTALRGDVRHPVIGVPEASLLLERGAEYERAGLTVNRLFRVFVSTYRSAGDTLQLTLDLPRGLRTDSAVRVVALPPFGVRNLFFPLRGTLASGEHTVSVQARSLRTLPAQAIGVSQSEAVREFTLGTVINDYPHIPSQHFVRFARDRFQSVELRVPPSLRIGYVRGTEDLRTALGQLRLNVVPIDIGLLPAYDLSAITTLLLGAGALRSETAAAAVPALQAFVARGGTIVVLNGGGEVARSGLFPFPIGVELGGGRVAQDSSDVRVLDAKSSLLSWPNAMTNRDYAAWLGDRTCSRLSLVDARYRTPLAVLDAAGKAVQPAIAAANIGKGMVIHTTLCLAAELEAAQPGAARLLTNLLSAGLQRP